MDDAGGLKPPVPGLPVIETQQREFWQIRRNAYAVTPSDELRAANRKKPLETKPYDVEPGPIAITVTNRKINVLACEVDVMVRCGNPEINLRMGLCEPTERLTSHLAAKSGDMLTVRTLDLRCRTIRSVPTAI